MSEEPEVMFERTGPTAFVMRFRRDVTPERVDQIITYVRGEVETEMRNLLEQVEREAEEEVRRMLYGDGSAPPRGLLDALGA